MRAVNRRRVGKLAAKDYGVLTGLPGAAGTVFPASRSYSLVTNEGEGVPVLLDAL